MTLNAVADRYSLPDDNGYWTSVLYPSCSNGISGTYSGTAWGEISIGGGNYPGTGWVDITAIITVPGEIEPGEPQEKITVFAHPYDAEKCYSPWSLN